MGRTHRVAIIQPAVPHYRVPFFTRLIAAAAREQIHVDVFSGETPTETRDRGDSSDAPFIRDLSTREVRIRRRTLFYKSTAPILRGHYDLVIVEHAVRNLETYELLLRLSGGKRLAFWGHGRTYTKNVSRQQEWFKQRLARRAAWFFGYTERGVENVVCHGYPRNRTTVLNNTIDTTGLREDMATISDSDIREFSRQHDLLGKTALFLGGLDSSKRIPFLLKSAGLAYERCRDFRLLIAGNGTDRPTVEQFVARHSWASSVGAVQGRNKALALAATQALSIPGRIGLVAVDSMVAGRPIVTTNFPNHAPEFDYLIPGVTAVVAENDVDSYAAELIGFLNDPSRRKEMSDRCQAEAQKYELDRMVWRFLSGIKSALA